MLKARGYDTHPKGMAQPFGVDFEKSSDGQTDFLGCERRRGQEERRGAGPSDPPDI